MQTFFNQEDATRMGKLLLVLVIAGALFMGMKFVNEVKRFGSIGVAPSQTNTIDVTGQGEAFAIPDVATASFTVEQKASTIAAAQTAMNAKIDTAITFLKGAGIAEKDIKTADYSAYPEYSYPNPCYDATCPTQEPKFLGYNVSQTVVVKIRDASAVVKVVDGLGEAGVTRISGPDFTVDNPDMVQAEARQKAIQDAEEKAQVLADELGVRLVRIVRFSDSNGSYPTPTMYDTKAELGVGGAGNDGGQLPAGENKYTSNVTITYEIR